MKPPTCSSPHAQASTCTSQCPRPSALLSVPSTPSAHAPSPAPAPCEVTLAARLRRSRGSSVGKSVSVTLDAPKRAATRPVITCGVEDSGFRVQALELRIQDLR